jgi:hypothetical protein
MPDSPFDDDLEQLVDDRVDFRNQQKQANWEERIVKMLLTVKGRQGQIRQLAQEHFDKTGQFGLTFYAFMKANPDFPVYFFCRKIPYVHELRFENVFKNPHKNKIVKTFTQLEAELPDRYQGKPYGVVFEWLHSGGQVKIVHNDFHVVRAYSTPYIYLSIDEHSGCVLENLSDYLLKCRWRQ